ncbi:hypothetical protein BO70DRAFT_382148 [Aspergillus heteromorphus CBS 117.55]|uniref:Methyltransferase n=1 Tax=Aspergillus heteromorphus CBS 117.55 TaxID=1448321 RepID=A0A317VCZ6_9EURO|nr:uncharacterized protein BO70DRAFT_382148 [Aspergillus heteromorphus CBS 117.55]PWY70947.1 hypothetical protein BO70DRAFT_382148 [Aspergillus heteromorphus CBS 117.55]
MLPTPCTSHVSFDTIYEPSEDSYLFLDTLASASESAWLRARFSRPDDTSANPSSSTTTTTTTATATASASASPAPLIVEAGTGSGVVLAFIAANSRHILGRTDVLALGTDVNRNACVATRTTVLKAIDEQQPTPTNTTTTTPKSILTTTLLTDLTTPLRPSSIDILLFNPPYVPTPDLPSIPTSTSDPDNSSLSRSEKFEHESYLLSLTYAGGKDGMETTERLLDAIPGVLSERGVAYVLLCAQNRPREVVERIRGWEIHRGGWGMDG